MSPPSWSTQFQNYSNFFTNKTPTPMNLTEVYTGLIIYVLFTYLVFHFESFFSYIMLFIVDNIFTSLCKFYIGVKFSLCSFIPSDMHSVSPYHQCCCNIRLDRYSSSEKSTLGNSNTLLFALFCLYYLKTFLYYEGVLCVKNIYSNTIAY